MLLSLYEKEKSKLANVTRGIKVVNSAISMVGHQAILKAQHMASIKPEVGRWSIILAKARCDKDSVDQK